MQGCITGGLSDSRVILLQIFQKILLEDMLFKPMQDNLCIRQAVCLLALQVLKPFVKH